MARNQILSRALISLLFLAAIFAHNIFATTKVNIAVLDLDSRGALSKSEAGTLTDRLRSMLVSTTAFNVLERGKMEEILTEVGFQQTGCTSTECVVQAGRILNVQQMIAGSIGKIGRLFTLDIILLDVETSKILKSFTYDHKGEIEGLIHLMEPVADEIATYVTTRQSAQPDDQGMIILKTSPVSAEVFIGDKSVGTTPLTLENLKPDVYNISIQADGFVTESLNVTLDEGDKKERTISLNKYCNLNVRSLPPQAMVFINEKSVGQTPVQQKFVEDTELHVTVEKEGFLPWIQHIIIDDDVEMTADLKREVGSLRLVTEPVSVEIEIDGVSAGKTSPERIELDPGDHVVKLSAPGYVPQEMTVTITKGTVVERNITLKKLITIHIQSVPTEAKVTINGSYAGFTPIKKVVPAGTRLNVHVTAANYEKVTRSIVATKDQTLKIELNRKSKSKTWLWISGGAAIIGGTVAVILSSGDNEKGEQQTTSSFPRPPGRP